MHARENMQRPTQLALHTKLDIRIQPIANHARPRAIELKLALDGIHHGLARLSQLERFPPGRILQGRDARPRPHKEALVHRQRRVRIRGQEHGPPLEIVQSRAQLEVVDVEIQPAQHGAHLGIQQRPVRQALKVRGRHVPPEPGIRAADAGDSLGRELGLHAGFAQREDLVLAGRELEDARDVHCRGVGRAEDVFFFAGDVELR